MATKRDILPSVNKKISESKTMSSTVSMVSETAFDFHCDLCDKDNNYIEAIGYCVDCKDYLCQECYNHHLRPKPMRHHVLLDQQRMPKDTSHRQSKDMCTESCATHKHETLKYYCSDHSQFGCGVCMALHHPNCEGVDHIPDISGDLLTSREYKDMILKVKYLTNTIQQALKTTQNKTNTTNQQHSDATELFKHVRKELDVAVNRLETSFMKDAGKIRDENQKKIKYVEDQYNKLLKDIGALNSKFTSLENKGEHCQIFFSIKRSQDEMADFETSLLQLQDQSTITEFVIKMSDDLQHLIQQPENMATLEIINNPTTSSAHGAPGVLNSRTKTRQKEGPGYTLVKPKPTAAVRKQGDYKTSIHVVPDGLSSPTKTPQKEAPVYTLDQHEPTAASTGMRKHGEYKKSLHVAPCGLSSPTKIKQKEAPDHTLDQQQPTTASTAVRKPIEYKTLAAVHVADIGVRMNDDISNPAITGSVVLPSDKLAMVDVTNDTVKLINLQSNKIVSHLKHDNRLFDITAVTNTQVAVTCPNGSSILFINVTNTLTLDYKVKVRGKCWGIASASEKLAITYCNPAKVEIISQTGELLQTLVSEDRGRQLFSFPQHVAVSPDQQTIYISDWDSHKVTSLDLCGQVKATYEDYELESPRGLTVDRAGMLYVSGEWSRTIHRLTPDLQNKQILLRESDGINLPRSVSYDEEQNKLYIGMWHSDSVKMFTLCCNRSFSAIIV